MSNKSVLMPCGENGITFTLFAELAKPVLMRNFIRNIVWCTGLHPQALDSKEAKCALRGRLIKEQILRIYLFPSFGRGHGPGEPDAMIVTGKYNIIVEVETEEFNSKQKDKHVREQLERFAQIVKAIHLSSNKRLQKKTIIKVEDKKFSGAKFRIRKIYKDLGSVKKIPVVLLISGDKVSESKSIAEKIHQLTGLPAGFISLHKIMHMKGIQNVVQVIKFNLKG